MTTVEEAEVAISALLEQRRERAIRARAHLADARWLAKSVFDEWSGTQRGDADLARAKERIRKISTPEGIAALPESARRWWDFGRSYVDGFERLSFGEQRARVLAELVPLRGSTLR